MRHSAGRPPLNDPGSSRRSSTLANASTRPPASWAPRAITWPGTSTRTSEPRSIRKPTSILCPRTSPQPTWAPSSRSTLFPARTHSKSGGSAPTRPAPAPTRAIPPRASNTVYWPSVIGTYTLQWPAAPREIVLASLIGSGTLDSLESLGTIYHQNDADQPGYNPNEEHALMAGGTAFALRDDLNITSGEDYSSNPFVLVSYTAAGRAPGDERLQGPARKTRIRLRVRLHHARRPVAPGAHALAAAGQAGRRQRRFGHQLQYRAQPFGGDLPGGWTSGDANGPFKHYQGFTWRDRKQDFWVYRGLHAGLPDLEAGAYDVETGSFGPLPDATAVVDEPFNFTLHASRQDEFLMLSGKNMPAWLRTSGLAHRGQAHRRRRHQPRHHHRVGGRGPLRPHARDQ